MPCYIIRTSLVQSYKFPINLMGCSCLISSQNSSKEKLPTVALKYMDYYEKPHKKISTSSANTNPEELLRRQSEQSKKEDTTVPSDAKPPSELTSSFITLSQLLEGQNNPQQQTVSYQSKIIRKGSKPEKKRSQEEKNEASVDKGPSLIRQISNGSNLQARMSQLDQCSLVQIRLQNRDFQFVLPNCRAGPLVVPLVIYNKYQI